MLMSLSSISVTAGDSALALRSFLALGQSLGTALSAHTGGEDTALIHTVLW